MTTRLEHKCVTLRISVVSLSLGYHRLLNFHNSQLARVW